MLRKRLALSLTCAVALMLVAPAHAQQLYGILGAGTNTGGLVVEIDPADGTILGTVAQINSALGRFGNLACRNGYCFTQGTNKQDVDDPGDTYDFRLFRVNVAMGDVEDLGSRCAGVYAAGDTNIDKCPNGVEDMDFRGKKLWATDSNTGITGNCCGDVAAVSRVTKKGNNRNPIAVESPVDGNPLAIAARGKKIFVSQGDSSSSNGHQTVFGQLKLHSGKIKKHGCEVSYPTADPDYSRIGGMTFSDDGTLFVKVSNNWGNDQLSDYLGSLDPDTCQVTKHGDLPGGVNGIAFMR